MYEWIDAYNIDSIMVGHLKFTYGDLLMQRFLISRRKFYQILLCVLAKRNIRC